MAHNYTEAGGECVLLEPGGARACGIHIGGQIPDYQRTPETTRTDPVDETTFETLCVSVLVFSID